jgi:hypothetical protein
MPFCFYTNIIFKKSSVLFLFISQVTTALVYLRQRNTYQENLIPPWHRVNPLPLGVGGSSSMDPSAPVTSDTSPQIGEIINNSGRKARMLVDAAIQVLY